MNIELAKIYNPTKSYNVNNWWVSSKYDGIRGIYLVAENKLVSRTSKEFSGLNHITSELNTFVNDLKAQELGDIETVEGELFIPNFSFDKISSIVRKTKNHLISDKELVVFKMFSIKRNWLSTAEMISCLSNNSKVIKPVNYDLIENTPTAIKEYLEESKLISEEGVMLRNPNTAYEIGRTNNLLKVKNFNLGVFTMKKFEKGTGILKNTLGKILVTQNQINTKVGSGLTLNERNQIWANQDFYLNKTCEILYLNITKNNSLRHPVFVKLI
jgi:DNA ligase 1